MGKGRVSFLMLVLGIEMRRTGSVVWRGGAGPIMHILVLIFAGGVAVRGVLDLDDSVEYGQRQVQQRRGR